MVFGLFESGTKVEIECDKQAYKKGDTAKCTVTLKMKKPVEGAGIKAIFAKTVGSDYEHMPLDEQEKNAKRTYKDGEQFNFSFKVTEGPAEKKGGLGGMISGMMEKSTGVNGYSVTAIFTPMKGMVATGQIALDTDPPSGNI